ncbi:citramalate synthase [Nocardioides sp. BP30]|uniref:citramalate synthase n=1 Tax=Nocardioides sp. BP30 TaxID=3036374 RepID=UPI0024693DC5|nr:citramalate synthase [Nocardioides sp. BP30]WGL54128.1 citramalate synthase [Nocardioides sp. BP30]
MTRATHAAALPRVEIVEEGMREGMQIEDASIPVADRVELLDSLSDTGLGTIVVGSFVRANWVPQMASVEEVIERMKVVPGVRYTALALNAKGVERRARFVPPLTVEVAPRLEVHACDVFVRRNTNRSQADEIGSWPAVVTRAVQAGTTEATVRVNAAFGSNFVGDIAPADVLAHLEAMIGRWEEAGIAVRTVWLGDPMGWNTPLAVETLLTEIQARWPGIHRFHLHLHNQRGAALVSAYAAVRALRAQHTLVLDAAIGGVGGCPYCGNGRATGMMPTEDLVDMVEEMGIDTGVDRDAVIEAAVLAERVFGHRLYGKTALAGRRPRGAALYPPDMPFVETLEEASHFRLGPEVYAGQRTPWREPITSPQLDRVRRAQAATRG